MRQTRRRTQRTVEEIRELIRGYESGTQSRAEFCAGHRLAVSTFDYYRRRYRRAEGGLVEVDLRGGDVTLGRSGGVAVVLSNGRRMEFDWAGLAQVAGHVQPLRALLALLEEA